MEAKVLIFTALAFLVSCSEIPVNQTLNPDKFYRRDMIVSVDGHVSEGAIVVPSKEKHLFKIEARGDLDLFTLQTCHREWTKERAWNVETRRRLFWKRKIEHKSKVDFEYKPTRLEKGYCPIQLGGFEKSKGRHSWAFIDFETPEAKLPAVVSCNGSEYNSRGVTVCQSKKGLKQLITFPVEVKVNPPAKCPLSKTEGKIFKYNIPKGRCVFAFKEKNGTRIHRLTTLDYEDILIRSL